MNKNKLKLLSLMLSMIVVTGCSTTQGSFNEKSHFSYPNSNVKALGAFKVTKSRTSFLIPPSFTREEELELMNEALNQKSGADLLVNYTVNTKFTRIPIIPFYTVEVTMEGTAASMKVGTQIEPPN